MAVIDRIILLDIIEEATAVYMQSADEFNQKKGTKVLK